MLWQVSSPGVPGEYCRNAHSPVLYKNLLLSDITSLARAIDKSTGKVLWTQPVQDDGSIVTPDILTVGGKDIFWAHGCRALLLPEGKPLKVNGWKEYGMQTLVKYDERDVVFFCGAGEHCGWSDKGHGEVLPPAAVRFTLEGDTLTGKVLWNGIDEEAFGGNRPWMTYYRGRLYLPGLGFADALTGKILAGKPGQRKGSSGACPNTDHLILVANNRVYGLDKGADGDKKADRPAGAVLEVQTPDGKLLAKSVIPSPNPTPEEKAMMAAAGGYTNWPAFSHGYTFTFGPDCIIIRGYSRLWCFGGK